MAAVDIASSLSGSVDVGSGRLSGRLVLIAAQPLGRRLELARARLQPLDVVAPPAALLGGGLLQPCVGVDRVVVGDPITRAALRTRRIDERLDVTSGGQH